MEVSKAMAKNLLEKRKGNEPWALTITLSRDGGAAKIVVPQSVTADIEPLGFPTHFTLGRAVAEALSPKFYARLAEANSESLRYDAKNDTLVVTYKGNDGTTYEQSYALCSTSEQADVLPAEELYEHITAISVA